MQCRPTLGQSSQSGFRLGKDTECGNGPATLPVFGPAGARLVNVYFTGRLCCPGFQHWGWGGGGYKHHRVVVLVGFAVVVGAPQSNSQRPGVPEGGAHSAGGCEKVVRQGGA